ncbi:hypothetical protein [Brevundimonas pishanensis]|uniref:hypothetical protein n=1 Tax=Brevundimonas pishanensis TaxID=2896315 RepID=UPI001FA72CE0|nr:hypothetical protein [Brevundimonas pishanensis]
MHDDLLGNRIEKISHEIRRIEASIADGSYSERLEGLYETLVDLEAVKVKRDLVDAQRQVAASQDAATKAQLAETALQNEIRGRSDEQQYWSRRFLTSLTVAHGVGFVTSLTALTRQPPPITTPVAAFAIISTFGLGLLFMGSLPISMARIDPSNPNPKRDAHRLFTAKVFAAVSVALLILGTVGVGSVAFNTFQSSTGTSADRPTTSGSRAVGIPSDEAHPLAAV